MDMAEVFGACRAEDEDDVEEHHDKTPQERPEDLVHEGLKRHWHVGEPEQHDEELVAIMRAESRLVDVPSAHTDLVVAGAHVELGEEACVVQFIEQIVEHLDREQVLGSDGIEEAIVDAEAP
jgi:hypothetical protein